MLCIVSRDGQSGTTTEVDRGEVQEKKFIILPGARDSRQNTLHGRDSRVVSRVWARVREKHEARVFLRVSKGKARLGSINNLELVNLNNFIGLWTTGLVSNYLVIKVKEFCFLGYISQTEEVYSCNTSK